MADRLAQMLEPGERVLYREPSRWLSHPWPLAACFLVGALLAWGKRVFAYQQTWAEAFDPIQAIGACGVALVIYVLSLWLNRFDMPLLISSRRLLIDHRTENDSQIVQVDLAEIDATRIAASGDCTYLLVRLQDGRERRLDCDHPHRTAAALARAKDLPVPAETGRLARMDSTCFILGSLPLGFVSLSLFQWDRPVFGLDSCTGAPPCDIAAGILGVALGSHLMALLLLPLLPFIAGPEETRDWLAQRPTAGWGRWTLWKNPLYARLVSLAFRQALHPKGPTPESRDDEVPLESIVSLVKERLERPTVPAPPQGRLKFVGPRSCVWAPVAGLTVMSLGSMLTPWSLWLLAQDQDSVLALFLAGLFLLFLLGCWLTVHASALLAIARMPRLATPEEAENWLSLRPKNRLARWSGWKHPLYFKLASWRYGRPILPHEAADNGHG